MASCELRVASCELRVARPKTNATFVKKQCEPNYCASCEEAKYCSKECQKIAWKTGNKITCNKT